MYFQAAGFNIKINFYASEKLATGDRLKAEITNQLKGFVLQHKPKLTDFVINIGYNPDIFADKKNKIVYTPLYSVLDDFTIKSSNSLSIDNFNIVLMHVLNSLLLRHHGFILHGSAIKLGGDIFIFTGTENAGKTTIVKMLKKKCQPLADDHLLIKKEKNTFSYFQSPLLERNQYPKSRSKRFTPEKIFMLRKSSDYKIEKLRDKKLQIQIISKLISKSVIFKQKNTNELFLDTLVNYNSKTDFYFLFFGRDKHRLLNLLNNGFK